MALHVQDEVSLVSEHFTADFTVILLVHVAVVLLHVNSQVSIQLKSLITHCTLVRHMVTGFACA